MRIGYPCINLSLECSGNKTFRLVNYSKERLIATIENNLLCLDKMLEFNVKHHMLFFRITSDLVPFASHPVCRYEWWVHLKHLFQNTGRYIRLHRIRVSMHPDQFTLINSPDRKILRRSERELEYHAKVLDLMELDESAKIQIHVGGVYGDKRRSMERFARRFERLDEPVRRRLVIENDERSYSLQDCLNVHGSTGAPVVLDVLHHRIENNGETLGRAIALQRKTWSRRDGIPIVDYSSQERGSRVGAHAHSIDGKDFKRFLYESNPYDFDLMLEIKDKERSTAKAVKLAQKDPRFKG